MVSRYEMFSAAISGIYHSIQKIERAEMAKYGLKGPHAQCLLVMKRYPQGVTAAQLCELCEKDKAAISRTVAELEHSGLVRRDDRDGKRYRSCLTLTEKGIAAAVAVTQRAEVAVAAASAGYNTEEQKIFTSILSLVAGNLQMICKDGLKETLPTESL